MLRRPLVYAASLAALFLLAMTVRVGLTAWAVGIDAPPDAAAFSDQVDYEALAWSLARGDGYTRHGEPTARRPPGAPALLAVPYLVFGHSYVAARVWWCGLSALTCVLVALFAGRVFGRGAGLVAGLVLAGYPGSFYYTAHFYSEPAFGLWLVLALAVTVVAWRRRETRWHVASGLVWGIALLTRPLVLFVGPFAALAVLALPRDRRMQGVRALAIQAVVAAAVLLPWVVRNHIQLGKPTISTVAGHTFWGANNELALTDPAYQGGWVPTGHLRKVLHPLPPGEIEMDSASMHHGLAFVKAHWRELPRMWTWRLARVFRPAKPTPNHAVWLAFTVSWLAIAPFALVGPWLAWRRARDVTLVMLLPWAALILTTLVFYGSVRFRHSLAPVTMTFAGLALHAALVRFGRALGIGGGRESADGSPRIQSVDFAGAGASVSSPLNTTPPPTPVRP